MGELPETPFTEVANNLLAQATKELRGTLSGILPNTADVENVVSLVERLGDSLRQEIEATATSLRVEMAATAAKQEAENRRQLRWCGVLAAGASLVVTLESLAIWLRLVRQHM